MRKNLLAISAISLFFQANAQYLTTVSNNAKVNVRKSAYIHNGGGLKTIGSGQIENRGSINIVGNNSSEVRTFETNGTTPKPYSSTDINFVNKINELDNYDQWENFSADKTKHYTYGQLKISGIEQNKITAYVNQEYRSRKHGAFQQIALPFFEKELNTLSDELGVTLGVGRWDQKGVLYWDNRNVRFNSIASTNTKLGTDAIPPYSYYIIGMKDFTEANLLNKKNTSNQLYFRGVPVSDYGNSLTVTLHNAGAGIDFGIDGKKQNAYREEYRSYIDDHFVKAQGSGNNWEKPGYGKNMYQLGNPFLTNLDLRSLFTKYTDLQGILFEPSGISYSSDTGGGASSYNAVTLAPGGDNFAGPAKKWLIVRPGQTFTLKFTTNVNYTLNLSELKTFSYNETRALGGKTANKSGSTFKQLSIIGLDKDNNEVASLYYVLSDKTVTGSSKDAMTQVGDLSEGKFALYEEDPDGNLNKEIKMLYINEANEEDYYGKPIVVGKFTPDIRNFKFEISENMVDLGNDSSILSSGESFYFKNADNKIIKISHNMIIPADGNLNKEKYNLYYGSPNINLSTTDTNNDILSRTYIYSKAQDSFVRFSKNWKSASIEIYDASGRLIFADKNIKANEDYAIKLDKKYAGVFFVKVISDKGELFQSKLLIK